MAPRLESLDVAECLRLLAEDPVKVGRVAVSDVRPTILPINYALVDGKVVFRSAPGTKLDFAARGAYVAFEADHVEPGWRRGWSVVVRGQASEVREEALLARVRQTGLEPWPVGERDHVVQIEPEVVTGRRLG